jgi:hypothetical protein
MTCPSHVAPRPCRLSEVTPRYRKRFTFFSLSPLQQMKSVSETSSSSPKDRTLFSVGCEILLEGPVVDVTEGLLEHWFGHG